MISEKMKPYVKNNSAIRMMFEEGNRLRAKYGADKVFDFSLGNPSVPAPDSVREAIIELVNTTDPTVLHGYMSNAGFEDVRETIAQSLNRRFGTAFSAHNLIMTVGAASGLNVILKTILNPGEEVIVFAPYFLEYGAYVRNYDGQLVEISPNTETFQPNLSELEEKITVNTRAVIVNTPHNPTGVVYSEDTIKELSAILEKKQQEFGSVIYLISDEPYRELAYDGVEVPYLTKYYRNTVVGYSYSKSLSLPGERIGYLVIPDELEDSATVITAAAIAKELGILQDGSLAVTGAELEKMDDAEFAEKFRNISVYASDVVLDTLKEIKTVYTEIKKGNKTVTRTIQLEKIDGATLEPTSVTITVPIEEYTEKTLEIPVVCTNLPRHYTLRTFPSVVKVSCSVPLSRFKDVSADDFEIRISFADLEQSASGTLPLQLDKKPSWVDVATISPDRIEFILEQTKSND